MDILLINCEVEIILTWTKKCVLADMTVDADANPPIIAPTWLEIQIADPKLYMPVVTLSKENNKAIGKIKIWI